MPKKSSKKIENKTETEKNQEMLIENFTQLQKILTNLTEKFDNLSNNISRLLELFENSAKTFEEKQKEPKLNKREQDYMEKLDKLIEQNQKLTKQLNESEPPSPNQKTSINPRPLPKS